MEYSLFHIASYYSVCVCVCVCVSACVCVFVCVSVCACVCGVRERAKSERESKERERGKRERKEREERERGKWEREEREREKRERWKEERERGKREREGWTWEREWEVSCCRVFRRTNMVFKVNYDHIVLGDDNGLNSLAYFLQLRKPRIKKLTTSGIGFGPAGWEATTLPPSYSGVCLSFVMLFSVSSIWGDMSCGYP